MQKDSIDSYKIPDKGTRQKQVHEEPRDVSVSFTLCDSSLVTWGMTREGDYGTVVIEGLFFLHSNVSTFQGTSIAPEATEVIQVGK